MDPTVPFTIDDDWDVDCVEGCEYYEHYFNGEVVTKACRWCQREVHEGIML